MRTTLPRPAASVRRPGRSDAPARGSPPRARRIAGILVGDDAHRPAGRVVLACPRPRRRRPRAASRARGPRRTGKCAPHPTRVVRPVAPGRPATSRARSAPARRSAGCGEGLVSSSPNTGTTGLGSEAIVTLSSRFIDATDHPLHLRGNASNGRTRPRLTLRRLRRSLGTAGADRDGRPAGTAVAGDDPRAAHVPAVGASWKGDGRLEVRAGERGSVDAVVAARARVADVDGRRDDGAAAPLGRRRRHRPAPRVHHQPAGGSLAGGAAGDPDPAGDHHPRGVGRRRVDPPRAAVLRTVREDGVCPPHGYGHRLPVLGRAPHHPRYLRLPRALERLERHRLQLSGRPLRQGVRGAVRRHHAAGDRRAHAGHEHVEHRHRDDRRLHIGAADDRGGRPPWSACWPGASTWRTSIRWRTPR